MVVVDGVVGKPRKATGMTLDMLGHSLAQRMSVRNGTVDRKKFHRHKREE